MPLNNSNVSLPLGSPHRFHTGQGNTYSSARRRRVSNLPFASSWHLASSSPCIKLLLLFGHFHDLFSDLHHCGCHSDLIPLPFPKMPLAVFNFLFPQSSSLDDMDRGFVSLCSLHGLITVLLARGLPSFPLHVVGLLYGLLHLVHHNLAFSERGYLEHPFACFVVIAHSLGSLPDILTIQSDGLIIWVVSAPDLHNLILGEIVIHIIVLAPFYHFSLNSAPLHVVDLFEQLSFHLLGEVVGASCPSLKELLIHDLLFDSFLLHQHRQLGHLPFSSPAGASRC